MPVFISQLSTYAHLEDLVGIRWIYTFLFVLLDNHHVLVFRQTNKGDCLGFSSFFRTPTLKKRKVARKKKTHTKGKSRVIRSEERVIKFCGLKSFLSLFLLFLLLLLLHSCPLFSFSFYAFLFFSTYHYYHHTIVVVVVGSSR